MINHDLLKAEGHYYFTLNCWERKKNKEIFFFLFFRKIRLDISCKLSPLETVHMKCQIQFYGKNKKTLIDLSSAEPAHSMVSNNSQMSVPKKKKVLQNYAFPEQWVYLFHPFH